MINLPIKIARSRFRGIVRVGILNTMISVKSDGVRFLHYGRNDDVVILSEVEGSHSTYYAMTI